jgi:hypothetical protein
MAAPDPAELPKIIDLASREAARYLESIAERIVRVPRAEEVAASFRGDLPEEGVGAERALEELVAGIDGAVHSAGPKFFHFVDGGTTPAALGADWLASALDQNTGAWVSSPLGGELEWIALGWLRDLFGLPAGWGGVRAQPPDRRRGDRGRARVLRLDHVRRKGCLPSGAGELGQPPGGHGPDRNGRSGTFRGAGSRGYGLSRPAALAGILPTSTIQRIMSVSVSSSGGGSTPSSAAVRESSVFGSCVAM